MAGLIPFTSSLMNAGFGDFYQMVEDFFNDRWMFPSFSNVNTFRLDIQEDANAYYITADLPGVQKHEINLSLDQGVLRIVVNREENKESQDKNFLRRERRASSMYRSVMLGDVDASGVSAKLENGVLSITVPKVAKPDTRVNIAID
jgi:HSP20 family protein